MSSGVKKCISDDLLVLHSPHFFSSNNFWEKAPLSVKLAESGTLSLKLLELKIMQTMEEKEVVNNTLFYP